MRDRVDEHHGAALSMLTAADLRDDIAGNRGVTVLTRAPLTGIVASRQKDAGGINLDAYYDQVEEILKTNYVEAIKDDEKLAVGAVRGMVTSLGDPESQFMDKDAFAAYQRAQDGRFAGIGVDFIFEPTSVDLSAGEDLSSDTDPTSDFVATRIPHLVVSTAGFQAARPTRRALSREIGLIRLTAIG